MLVNGKKIFGIIAIIILIVNLTGCSVKKQNIQTNKQVPNANTQKTDNDITENNELPVLLTTIDDTKNSKEIIFTNGYKSGLVEDGTCYIIAELGALKSDPKQGAAIIKTINKDGTKILNEKVLLTPEKHGSIKADGIGADSFGMSVTAEDGYKWILNVCDGFRITSQ